LETCSEKATLPKNRFMLLRWWTARYFQFIPSSSTNHFAVHL